MPAAIRRTSARSHRAPGSRAKRGWYEASARIFGIDSGIAQFRAFVTAMLRTRGVEPGERSVPFWLAHAAALAMDGLWTAARARTAPPLVHATVHLIGQEMTVDDRKARRDVGYVGKVTREAGLASLAEAGRRAA